MRRSMCVMIVVLLALAPGMAVAQMDAQGNALSKEFAGQVDGVAQKWISLFEAMPESKLDWRPAEGVRSVRELFTHIGDANYFFMTFMGAKMPESGAMPKDQAERENRFKTKADIAKHLAASFDFAKKEFAKRADKDFEKEISMFGSKTTGRNGMLINLGHMHEHLGQAIAYARMNGVTPPWSLKGE